MGRKVSSIWNHFTVLDQENCTATCNTCGRYFSYRTSISNLKKHLTRANHPLHLNFDSPDTAVEFIELDGLPEDDGEEEADDGKREGQVDRCQLVIEEGVIHQNQSQDILDISHNTFNTLQTGSEQDKDLNSVANVNLDLRQAFQNGIEGIADITDNDLNVKSQEPAKVGPQSRTQKEAPRTSTTKFAQRSLKFSNSVSSSGIKGRTSSTSAADSSSDNEFELFGRHVSNQLRKLSKVNSFLAQDEIQSILTRYRIYESMSDGNRRSILNSEK